MSKSTYYIERVAAIAGAIILLQTLYFKFTGHPDSVHIFSELGVEPYGRIGLGVVELITAILLLYPKTSHLGGLSAIGIMIGAIVAHVFIIGTNVNNDGGTLFLLALAVFICGCIVTIIKRDRIKALLPKK